MGARKQEIRQAIAGGRISPTWADGSQIRRESLTSQDIDFLADQYYKASAGEIEGDVAADSSGLRGLHDRLKNVDFVWVVCQGDLADLHTLGPEELTQFRNNLAPGLDNPIQFSYGPRPSASDQPT